MRDETTTTSKRDGNNALNISCGLTIYITNSSCIKL